MLDRQGESEDSGILKHLDLARIATVEQIAYITHLEEPVVKEKLKIFIANQWVWVNKTKLTKF
ncbi:MAG TPA: hypothetical protein VJ488_02875 [Dehalococcoidia bacterium]|nr:hypothetical protein [Dehalococcoidia bacterium]